ncbi:PREDICTED: neuropeptide-like protein C4orf48 homolog isoform X3 [Hipposideros armiger]|uniref:NELL2-interacting cell ontogeny regulator 1 n=1 Tax=Hipposideros armiger TaxID=186990 RepID=A0A8B7SM21_HIPAR|nr:PREDICTED: neuropeptide-like protein C4orf48 homolog isoform X3 [Hipposideros armiger]
MTGFGGVAGPGVRTGMFERWGSGAAGSLRSAMAPPPPCRPPRPPRLLLLLLTVVLLGSQARAEPAAGSAVPAQSRPCVDCHAFEFMQRALQDLRKTAYSLDARVRGGTARTSGLRPQAPRPDLRHSALIWL